MVLLPITSTKSAPATASTASDGKWSAKLAGLGNRPADLHEASFKQLLIKVNEAHRRVLEERDALRLLLSSSASGGATAKPRSPVPPRRPDLPRATRPAFGDVPAGEARLSGSGGGAQLCDPNHVKLRFLLAAREDAVGSDKRALASSPTSGQEGPVARAMENESSHSLSRYSSDNRPLQGIVTGDSSPGTVLQQGSELSDSSREMVAENIITSTYALGDLLSKSRAAPHQTDSSSVSFRLREEWVSHESALHTDSLIPVGYRSTLDLEKARNEDDASSAEGASPCCFMLKPTSYRRLFWVVLCGLAITWDSIRMPLQLMDPPEWPMVYYVDWFTQIFWNVDILVSFCSGYIEKGVVVMGCSNVAKRYLRSWFPLDFTVVCIDWIFFLVSEHGRSSSSAAIAKVTRVLRTFRALRMVRLLKLQTLLNMLEESITELITITSVFKVVLCIASFNHLVACVWFRVGSDEEAQGWVHTTMNFGRPIREAEFRIRYLASYHWALVQFTGSGSSIEPQTVSEYGVALVVTFVALVGASFFVGNITNAMFAVQRQFWEDYVVKIQYRTFCGEYRIPLDLTRRAENFVEYVNNQKKRHTDPENVFMLTQVSEPLMVEIMSHVRMPFLATHAVFRGLTRLSRVMMQVVCRKALSQQALGRYDPLFTHNSLAAGPYHIINGLLRYENALTLVKEPVEAGAWVSEATLWTRWVHVGSLWTEEPAQVLVVSCETFLKIISANSNLWLFARRYAQTFVAHLCVLAEQQGSNDLSDLLSLQQVRGGVLSDASKRLAQRFQDLPEEPLPEEPMQKGILAAFKEALRSSKRKQSSSSQSSSNGTADAFPKVATGA